MVLSNAERQKRFRAKVRGMAEAAKALLAIDDERGLFDRVADGEPYKSEELDTALNALRSAAEGAGAE